MRFHHFGKCVSQLSTGVTPMQFYACLSDLFYRPRPQLLSEFWTVRNDVQVVRSYKLLQSVIAKSFSSNLAVGTEMAGGRLTSLGFCHLIDWSNSQAQYNRNHVSWSSVEESAEVSAERVLVTTLGIVFVPQDRGLTGHVLFWLMPSWVARMIIPAWDSGFAFDANDASEKARNRRSSALLGLILIVTSLCFFACGVSYWLLLLWIPLQCWFEIAVDSTNSRITVFLSSLVKREPRSVMYACRSSNWSFCVLSLVHRMSARARYESWLSSDCWTHWNRAR